MARTKLAALAAAVVAGCLIPAPSSQGGLWERWRSGRGDSNGEILQVQDAGGGGGLVPGTARSGAEGQPTPGTPPGGTTSGGAVAGPGPQTGTDRTPKSPGEAGGGGGLVPGTARSEAEGQARPGNPPGGAAGPASTPESTKAPTASGCHDIVVEVPSGICCKKKVCVHCRGCPPGRLIKVCGQLPCCVKCQPQTFKVVNPTNGCPVEVTACLPDKPEKAKKVDKD